MEHERCHAAGQWPGRHAWDREATETDEAVGGACRRTHAKAEGLHGDPTVDVCHAWHELPQ
jgi:hypothetical protein